MRVRIQLFPLMLIRVQLLTLMRVRILLLTNVMRIYTFVRPSPLKVPKCENFSIAFFAQSEPIWICDVGTSKKIEFFSQLTPDFDGFLVLCRILSVR